MVFWRRNLMQSLAIQVLNLKAIPGRKGAGQAWESGRGKINIRLCCGDSTLQATN